MLNGLVSQAADLIYPSSIYGIGIFLILLSIGITISAFIPVIFTLVMRKFVSSRIRKQVERPLVRFLQILVIVVTMALAFPVLGYSMTKKYTIYGFETTLNSAIWNGVGIFLLIVLVVLTMPSIVSGLLKVLLPADMIRKRAYYTRKFMNPIYGIMVIVIIEMVILLFPDFPYTQPALTFFNFLLIVLGSLLIGRVIALSLKVTFSKTYSVKEEDSSFVVRLATWLIYIIGISVAFSYIGLDLWAIATSLGLIGFAIAFGLQDAIADIAAGLVISAERPFSVGDRIVVNVGEGHETYADVMEIGVRSTKVKTIENQVIYIPNSMLTREMIWNMNENAEEEEDYVTIRVPIGISYDSDWRLAERIMLDAAREHPSVLEDPHPRVLLMGFGQSSIQMELWCSTSDVKDIFVIKSDLMKRIKDRFDEIGVEIPFSYHTLVWKKELPHPKKIDEVVDQLEIVQRKIGREGVVNPQGLRILIPSAGAGATSSTIKYVLSRFNPGDTLIVLYVAREKNPNLKTIKALPGIKNLLKLQRHGFNVDVVVRSGEVVPTILSVAQEIKADIILMGASRRSTLANLIGGNIVEEVTRLSPIPTVVVPFQKKSKR